VYSIFILFTKKTCLFPVEFATGTCFFFLLKTCYFLIRAIKVLVMVMEVVLDITPYGMLNIYPHLGRTWLPLGILIEVVNVMRLMLPEIR
jgi:hypothetical protein